MKKIFSLIVALVATVGAFAQQPVGTLSVAPKVGMNLATMTKVDEGSMRLGLVGGVDLTYQVSDAFAVSGGLFYSQQGVKGSEYEDEMKTNVTLKNDYFNVPILANYYVAPGLALKAGVQLGALLSAKVKSEIVETDNKEAYNSLDFSIPVGLSYEISNVIIDARYNIGLTKSIKGFDGYEIEGSNNGVIMLTVGYKFNL